MQRLTKEEQWAVQPVYETRLCRLVLQQEKLVNDERHVMFMGVISAWSVWRDFYIIWNGGVLSRDRVLSAQRPNIPLLLSGTQLSSYGNDQQSTMAAFLRRHVK